MTKHANCWGDDTEYDYVTLVAELNKYLRLRTDPIGMKRFASVDDFEGMSALRRPNPKYGPMTMDQFVGQSRWRQTTIGITMEDLVGPQCGAPLGLYPRDEEFLSGNMMNGVWFGDLESSAKHQREMSCPSYGDYQTVALSPLTAGQIGNPDICLIYGTPSQMIILMNGLQYRNYKKYTFTCVGESACADSWGNALKTGEPSMSIPCYAERSFGGVQEDEMLIALQPKHLPPIVEGLKALKKTGFSYPIPSSGLNKSPIPDIATIYGSK